MDQAYGIAFQTQTSRHSRVKGITIFLSPTLSYRLHELPILTKYLNISDNNLTSFLILFHEQTCNNYTRFARRPDLIAVKQCFNMKPQISLIKY